MIRIDHISFEFAAPDEKFAYGLYAEWDNFCRDCFEQTVEECCAAYDREKVLYEIGRLELDLGTIPEEDFYREFPRRLKEELQRALPPLQTHTPGDSEKSSVSRRDNLLFFLRYGFSKPEWADGAFDPSEETGWLLAQPVAFYMPFITRAALLCLEQGHALRRLLWQTDSVEMLLRMYAAALAEPSTGVREKHRFLALMLEDRPDIPVRFVHEVGNDGELQGMAALLDSPTVRRLIHTETREHADVDLPPYWHYLYEWLIRYYPFNGLAVFGGKPEFVRHLHHRLLTFIRKRNGSPCLSKRELTFDFLLEVFGSVYYREVLNAIYGLQPRNADGSPAYDGYFNRELYRVFMELSLLESPAGLIEDIGGEKETGGDNAEYLKIPADTKELTVLLKGNTRSDTDKCILLEKIARQQPGLLLEWIREEALKDETLLSLLSNLTDNRMINRLLAALSFTALETAEKVRTYLENQSKEIAWLKGITEPQRQAAFRKAVLHWMADANMNRSATLQTLLSVIYREMTGSGEGENAVEELAEELDKMEIPSAFIDKDRPETEITNRLQKTLSDKTLQETVKRRAAAAFWEAYSDNYAQATVLLQAEQLLAEVIRQTGSSVKEEIIRHQTIRAFGTERAITLLPLFIRLMAHETELPRVQVTGNEPLTARLLYWLATQSQGQALTTAEIIRSLFAVLWGERELPAVIKRISGITATEEDAYETEALATLLEEVGNNGETTRMSAFQEWNRRKENLSDTVQTLFEKDWSTAEKLADWLKNTKLTAEYKWELLQTAVTERPREWTTLLRNMIPTEKTFDTLIGYLSAAVVLHGMARVNFYQASILSRVAERIEHHTDMFPFLFANVTSLSSALSKALLRYMLEADTLERTLTEKEIIEKFLSVLYIIYKGETGSDYQKDADWQQLAVSLNPETEPQGNDRMPEQTIAETTNLPLPVESLARTDFPETLRQRLLRHFLRFRPKELLDYIRRSVSERSLLLTRWTEWLDSGDWTSLAVNLSLSAGELLRQVMEVLHPDERTRRLVWGSCLTTGNKKEEWTYNSPEENIRSFMQSINSVRGQKQSEAEVENVIRHIEEELHLQKETIPGTDDIPEFFLVGNAGLCLLSPWLIRLFGMLGYLDEERKKLKDTASKVRAVFLLQYLVYGEEREYRELELNFNRLLSGLSRHVPLPKRLLLTKNEKQTADSMVAGVKANWSQLKGTSVRGFRQSFIARNGTLERQEERWQLLVEKKMHDILLESVPWSFRQIRLPWLKKYIQVVWNEKQEFD